MSDQELSIAIVIVAVALVAAAIYLLRAKD